jgi:type IV pilus assembly protein PilC
MARRLYAVRQLLESGTQLSVALERGVPEMSPRLVMLTAAAERIGRLSPALSRITSESQGTAQRDSATQTLTLGYVFMMFTAIGTVLSFQAIFVMPKYKEIMRDFGMTLPPITEFVFGGLQNTGFILGPLVLIFSAMFCGAKLWEVFNSRDDVPPIGIGEWLAGFLPLIRPILHSRNLGDVCYVLADALEVERPASVALAEAAHLRLMPQMRTRVRAWWEGVERGLSLADAAREAGMPPLLVGMLATARGSDDSARVMRFLAGYYATRFSRALTVARAALIPALVICFGVIVAVVSLSLFVPLVQLSDHVMPMARSF